jgi:hypothetical protein
VTGISGNPSWLIQSTREIFVASTATQPSADASSSATWSWATLEQLPPILPNLVPFEAYDHFSLLSLAGCPLTALGIGLFLPNPARAPRKLDIIHFPDNIMADGEYSVLEIPSDANVVTSSAVVSVQHDSALIGVIGELGGANTFSFYQLSSCDQMDLLAEMSFNFDYRTAPTPGFGAGSHIPRTNGIKLLSSRDPVSGVVTFAHYDGYDIWLFKAEQIGDTWHLTQERQAIHAERTDLSVPQGIH